MPTRGTKTRERVICSVAFRKKQADYDALAIAYSRNRVIVQPATLTTKGLPPRAVFAVVAERDA